MTFQVLQSARRYFGVFFLAQLLLAAFTPLLHAYTAPSVDHANNVHMHFPALFDDVVKCAETGKSRTVLAVGTSDSRVPDDIQIVAAASITQSFVSPLTVLPAYEPSHATRAKLTLRSGAAATPQAP